MFFYFMQVIGWNEPCTYIILRAQYNSLYVSICSLYKVVRTTTPTACDRHNATVGRQTVVVMLFSFHFPFQNLSLKNLYSFCTIAGMSKKGADFFIFLLCKLL